jgi:hypothetical protein
MKWKPGDKAKYIDGDGTRWPVTIKQVDGDELRAITDDGRDIRDESKYFTLRERPKQ